MLLLPLHFLQCQKLQKPVDLTKAEHEAQAFALPEQLLTVVSQLNCLKALAGADLYHYAGIVSHV